MMIRRLLLGLILLCISTSVTRAEENCYRKADRDLQRVYEHFEGVSLEKAIDKLLADKYGLEQMDNNVQLRFNGGGIYNRVFIGRKNTLEIIVRNNVTLAAMCLCFEFTCPVESFNWVEGYGDYPVYEKPNRVVKLHDSAFTGNDPWLVYAVAHGYPDSILIGAITLPSDFYGYCPLHSMETVLYSMQIELPYDTSMIGEEFCIDNIFIPPAAGWMFTDSATAQTIVPKFQGNTNKSENISDAPPVCFTIAQPIDDFVDISTDPNMAYTKEGKLYFPEPPIDFEEFPGLRTERDGVKTIGVSIKFEGKDEDLTSLGVNIHSFRPEGYSLGAKFPLSLLPQVCQVKGVKRISPMQKATNELN
jgi:hypothetical protein